MKETHIDPSTGRNEMAPPSGAAPAARAPRMTAPRSAQAIDPANPETWGRVARNQACPCGSGKKYKHCHGAVGEASA